MPIPDPFPGLALHYSYLWYDQHRRGLEEGTKERPCVVILALVREEGETVVTVAPITHTPPKVAGEGIEIPPATKGRLGMDDGRSWVIVSEINQFCWPGPDLRPLPGKAVTTYEYGVLPPGLFRQVREGVASWVRSRKLRTSPRA